VKKGVSQLGLSRFDPACNVCTILNLYDISYVFFFFIAHIVVVNEMESAVIKSSGHIPVCAAVCFSISLVIFVSTYLILSRPIFQVVLDPCKLPVNPNGWHVVLASTV
jgi:hypothetical protein